nr:unknown [Medicago truncatula]
MCSKSGHLDDHGKRGKEQRSVALHKWCLELCKTVSENETELHFEFILHSFSLSFTLKILSSVSVGI